MSGYASSDILTDTFELFVDGCMNLDDGVYSLIVKAATLLLCIVAFLQAAINEGNKSKGLQLLIILVAAFLLFGWHVPIPYRTPKIKAFIVMLSVFATLGLPLVLPKRITTTRSGARGSVWMIYGLILLFLAMQLLKGYS